VCKEGIYMQATERDINEICCIAQSVYRQVEDCELAVRTMKVMLIQAVEISSLPPEEIQILKHIIGKVAGVDMAMDALKQTAQRARTLNTAAYEEAGRALVDTIYQQRPAGGVTGERTFPNKKASLVKEDGIGRYLSLRDKYPILKVLGEKPAGGVMTPTQQWAEACGYDYSNQQTARGTIQEGLNAFLWEGNNPVQEVHTFSHPSGEGSVYVILMKETVGDKVIPPVGQAWVHEGHRIILVEVTGRPSRRNPFTRRNLTGWEAVMSKVLNIQEVGYAA
jgi:hypothetical protein